MRQVKYFCDICGKEATNPKEEMSCVELKLDYVRDWTMDLPLSKVLHDIRICKECGEHLNAIVKVAIERKGFN